MGGGGEQPFDRPGADVISAMRSALGGRQPYQRPLTEEERTEAGQRTDDEVCRFCLGLHKFPGGPGCPRLATFKLNGDGLLIEGSYWPGKEWAQGRVVLVEDIHEDGEEEAGGD
jgi:hypothetical protein